MDLTNILDFVYNIGECEIEKVNPEYIREWAKYYELKSKLGNFHDVVIFCLDNQMLDTRKDFLREYFEDYSYRLNNREEVA
ncbi:hypothetical protein NHG29_03230 [Aerococcaceae bacterium NML160702]|nr:hypothetical protein [Aerococcaceae bacterium NML160702]